MPDGHDTGSPKGGTNVVSGPTTMLARPNRGAMPLAGRGRTFLTARRHSIVVRILKFAIPIGSLLAVAIVGIGTVYSPFARLPGLTVGPVSISGTKIAMESPRLTGFRKDKRPYEVTATTAYQDIRKPNVIELKEMKAKLATDDAGTLAYLVSKIGIMDTSKDHLDLSQDIRVWTAKGEEILLKSASVDLKAGAVQSRELVKVSTPTLTLEAASLDLVDSGKTITFVGQVRVKLLRGMDGGAAAPVAANRTGTGVSQAKFTQAGASDRP